MDATFYGNRAIALAKHSVEAARRQWRNTAAAQKEHRMSGEVPFVPVGRDGKPRSSPLYIKSKGCPGGCGGCRELERIKAAIEALWNNAEVQANAA